MAFKLSMLVLAVCLSAPVPVRAETFKVDNWPRDVDNIPCSAWTKSGDGTWVLNGSIMVGASELTNVGVKGDAAARAIEKKCGRK